MLPVGEDTIDVTITVDPDGRLRQLATQRWGDPDPGHFEEVPFGGRFDTHADIDGVTVATAGRVGWWWGTPAQTKETSSAFGSPTPTSHNPQLK